MSNHSLPNFSKIAPENIIGQLQEILKYNRDQITLLLSQTPPFTWDNLLNPLEDLEDKLHHFWSPISHLHAVDSQPQLREAYNAALPLITEYNTELGQNQALHQAIKQIGDSPEYQALDSAQKMVIKHLLRDFNLAGVALPLEKKQRFAELTQDLSKLGAKFEENVLDATEGWNKHITDPYELAGIPESAIHAAKAAANSRQLEGWLFTLEAPSYIAIMLHADSPALRQEMYTAYVTRASDQGPMANHWDNSANMQDMLSKRLQKAQLLGFKNFAELSLVPKMVNSPQQVLDFLEHLLTASRSKAHEDIKELTDFAGKHLKQERTFQPWDVGYYSEKLRQERYAISQDELRAYFPLEKVLSGLFAIVNRLFGMNFQRVESVDVWHPDVRCYSMSDSQNQLRSYFYIDLYARQNKRGGAWMDEYAGRRRLSNGRIQPPVAFLTCNFQAPVEKAPSLLTHEEVQTLFHEFGHCLQHMLTQVDYAAVSGINGVPWDAVELASQILENWAWEKESIHCIAEHHLTKQPLPDELFERMWKARNFQQGMQMLRQLEFALFDFKLHIEFDPSQSGQIQRILNEVRQQTALIPAPAFNRFQNSFTHIFGGGYAAGYYSYKWAEVMASDAFDLFLEKGIFDSATSQQFLRTFLESGGAADPLDLFIQFRGRPPQVEALLRHSGII